MLLKREDLCLETVEETAKEEVIEILGTDEVGVGALPNVCELQLPGFLVPEQPDVILDLLVEVDVGVVIGLVEELAFGVQGVLGEPRGWARNEDYGSLSSEESERLPEKGFIWKGSSGRRLGLRVFKDLANSFLNISGFELF